MSRFTEASIIKSQNAVRKGIDNAIAAEHRHNLPRLLDLLDEVEAVLGCQVTLGSGYRSPKLNAATPGSSKTSAHSRCLAVDFEVPGMSNLLICQKLAIGLKDYDQIIYEFGEPGWVHVGLSESLPGRRQKLTARKNAQGKTEYPLGFVA
jgi:hypothetical protein